MESQSSVESSREADFVWVSGNGSLSLRRGMPEFLIAERTWTRELFDKRGCSRESRGFQWGGHSVSPAITWFSVSGRGTVYQLIQYLWTQAVDGHFNLPANNWVSPPSSSVHWVYKVSGFWCHTLNVSIRSTHILQWTRETLFFRALPTVATSEVSAPWGDLGFISSLDPVHPTRKQVLNLGIWSSRSIGEKEMFMVSVNDRPLSCPSAFLLAQKVHITIRSAYFEKPTRCHLLMAHTT